MEMSRLHSVKSIRVRSYFGPYSDWMPENKDYNNSECGYFSTRVFNMKCISFWLIVVILYVSGLFKSYSLDWNFHFGCRYNFSIVTLALYHCQKGQQIFVYFSLIESLLLLLFVRWNFYNSTFLLDLIWSFFIFSGETL